MSQPLLCDLGRDAKRKHDRGIDMPKVMKPNVFQIIRFQESPKLHGKGIAFVGRTVLLADDVIVLSGVAFCFGVFQQPQQRSGNLNLPSAALCFRGFGDRLIVDSYQIFFDSETAGLKIHMMPPQCEQFSTPQAQTNFDHQRQIKGSVSGTLQQGLHFFHAVHFRLVMFQFGQREIVTGILWNQFQHDCLFHCRREIQHNVFDRFGRKRLSGSGRCLLQGKDPFLNVNVFQLLQTGISKLWNDVLFRLIDVVLYSGRGKLIFHIDLQPLVHEIPNRDPIVFDKSFGLQFMDHIPHDFFCLFFSALNGFVIAFAFSVGKRGFFFHDDLIGCDPGFGRPLSHMTGIWHKTASFEKYNRMFFGLFLKKTEKD